MREEARDEIFALRSRARAFVAAQCEGRAGERALVFLRAPGGGEVGSARLGAGIRGRGAAGLRAGADGKGVVVRLRLASDLVAAAGATGAGGLGVSLPGGRGGAGPL